MKKIKEGIKTKTYTKYQKLFDELYTWKDITKKTLLMLLIIVIVDYLNIFTKIAFK